MSDKKLQVSSGKGLESRRAEEGFSLLLFPVDVLNKMHGDFSAIVGSHLADHVFYQTGYLCGEVSSRQFEDFGFEGKERISILEEMIDQSGFGVAKVEPEGEGGVDLRIHLSDAGEGVSIIRPPGIIFAAGFIAGFSTILGNYRYRCIWDSRDDDDDGGRGDDHIVLHLAGVPKAGALLGKSIDNALKEGGG